MDNIDGFHYLQIMPLSLFYSVVKNIEISLKNSGIVL